MKRSAIVIAMAILFSFAQESLGGNWSFIEETKRATKALNCQRPKVTPASPGFGALYGCIAGRAETVKFFINEKEGTDQVKNVKLMWNDWFVDVGHGLHVDKKAAQFFVGAFARLYAPDLDEKLASIFFSNSNTNIETSDYRIVYTYKRGPKIDERLFVLTSKRMSQ